MASRAIDESRLVDALSGSRWVTVHGLCGMGTSTAVATALAGQPVFRVDARRRPPTARELDRVPRAGWVFVDDVVWSAAARRLVERLAEVSRRVVVAAARPAGAEEEGLVALPPRTDDEVRAWLTDEARRRSVSLPESLDSIVRAVDGWTLAMRTALTALRLGLDLATHPMHAVWPGIDDALRRATWKLSHGAGRLLHELCVGSGEALDAGVLVAGPERALALDELFARHLVAHDDDGVRPRRPVARWVVSTLGERSQRRAEQARATHVLQVASVAWRRSRSEPVQAARVLRPLRADLLWLSSQRATAARAAVFLEPIFVGALRRREVLSFYRSAFERHPDDPRIALALTRTLVGRGEHESALEVLATEAWNDTGWARASRAILRAHLAAWRDDPETATRELSIARALVDRERSWEAEPDAAAPDALDDAEIRWLDVREDLALQRVFVALRAGSLDDAEHANRLYAEIVAHRPSPRGMAIAQRNEAEVRLRRGEPAEAARSFEASRDELVRIGDEVAALYLTSRLVEAWELAGETERARYEAERSAALAARADEAALEVTHLLSVDSPTADARVRQLAFRVQVPSLRTRAERRPASASAGPSVELVLEAASAATLFVDAERRSLSLARRPALARVLAALVAAHPLRIALDAGALFRAGWPDDRAGPGSRRQRVQTAVWELRRQLLGEWLQTSDEGYALSPTMRVVERGG
jgi:hypothetical protein